ncbi:MAG: PAS domain S-box protein [Phycisphaerae bacterium]
MSIEKDELQAQITYRLIESLSTSEKRYETLVESLQEVVFESDLKGTLKFLNSAWESTLGYSTKESLGRPLSEFVFEDDKKSCLELFNSGKEHPSSDKHYTLRFLHKNGHLLWLVVSVTTDGKCNVSGSLHDITELRETSVSKDYVDSIIKSMIDTLIVVNPDGKIRTINPVTVELLGYKEEELIGRPAATLFAEEQDTPIEGTRMKKLIEGGSIKDYDTTYKTKSGKKIPVSFSGSVMRNKEGKLVGIVGIAHDMREVRKLLTELNQIYDGSPSGMRVIGKDFNIISQNKAMGSLSGMGKEATRGRKCYDQLKSTFCGTENCTLMQILKGKETVDIEVEKERADGKKFPCRVMAAPFKDIAGNTIGIIEVLTDITELKRLMQKEKALAAAERKRTEELKAEITERKRAEEELARKQRNLEAIFDAAPVGMLLVDENTVIKRTNDVITRLISRDSSAIIDSQPGEGLGCIHASDDNKGCGHGPLCSTCPIRKTVEDVLRSGQTVREVEVQPTFLVDGKEVRPWLEVSAEPILIDGSKHVIVAIDDLTGRKQAEAKLKHTAEEWRTTFDSITDMVSIHDKDFKIIRANKSFANTFKMELSEIIGKTCYELIHKTKEPPLFCPHIRTLGTGKPNRKEFFEPRLGIYVEASTSPLFDEDGQIMASVHIAKDITERKQAEAELKAAQEKLIETAHRAGMAEVAADVLHNVGNVLNSINVSTTVIREKVTSSELANLEKVASIINEHTDDLGTFLTEDPQGKHIPVYLTEVSKCLTDEQTDIIDKLKVLTENVQHIKDIVGMQQDYTKVSGVEVQTSLSKLVEDAIQINSAGLERHGTRLIREFEELGDVEIDKQKALQILVNLINNAKYALSSSNREEKLLTIQIYKHCEDRFRIEVADNGVGISEDNLTKIFSYGFTTKKDGHGVGLHSSALAAKEMGGTLTVYSDGVGQGATFTLELPFKPVEVMK